MFKLLTKSGLELGAAVSKLLSAACAKLKQSAPKIISQSMLWTARNHVRARFPGSRHWDPSKITTKNDGSIDVGIAGAGRAYHDVTIRPVNRKYLAIPMHALAYGKKPADFPNLFTIKGKHALFMKQGGGIIAMFALAKKAFQPQDKTLLPSDETFQKNIETRLEKAYFELVEKESRNA